MDLTAANDELSKTKIALMARPDSTFFTSLCFSMKHVLDASMGPTACTDGRHVWWNPDFFMATGSRAGHRISLRNHDERLFALVHECMHPAYMHMLRMPAGACPDRWNIACDHVINLQLNERGFAVPDWVHCDPRFKGMSAEEVYKLLPDNPGQPSMQDLKDPGGDKSDKDALARDLEDVLVRARIQSKLAGDKPGTIPGEIEIFLNKLLDPVLPFGTILRRFFQSFDKTDYSWTRPNRRHFPENHLPSLWGQALIDLCWAVDSSGSVTDPQFLRFISEIHGVMKGFKPKKMTLLDFDTRIHHEHHIASVEELKKVKFSGRGGTDVTPVFNWAEEHKPQVLLIFTDGGFNYPKVDIKVPVVWLIHNNPKWTAPYGQVIHYQIK